MIQRWGTFTQNDEVIALICPTCGAFVSTATNQETGVSARQVHIAFHLGLEENLKCGVSSSPTGRRDGTAQR